MVMSQAPAPPRSKPRAAPLLRLATSSAPQPDGETVRRFQQEMLPHLDAAYSFARLLTRGDPAAEDIVHDAYIRALKAFSGFRGENPKAWLMAIVRNCFLSWAKGKGAHHVTTEEIADVAEERETPEAALMRAEDASLMQRLIESLPRQLGEIIVLREVEELSYRDIAAALDLPIGTVMSRLARARAALAEAWARAEAPQ
jgi:RNA polymerase sigma-70 factor (ECF subfamily)